MSSSGKNIEDLLEEMKEGAREVTENADDYSQETVDMAEDYMNMAEAIADESKDALRAHKELENKYGRSVEKLEKCYNAIENLKSLEEQHQKTRRTVLMTGLGSAAAVLAGIIVNEQWFGGSGGSSTILENQWYSFDEVHNCLNDDQMGAIEDGVDGVNPDELQYKFVRDGESRSNGWDVYIRKGTEREQLGKLNGQDIYCEVK